MLSTLGFPNAFISATLFGRHIEPRATFSTTFTSQSQCRSIQRHQRAGDHSYTEFNSILLHIENKHLKICFKEGLQEEATYIQDSHLSLHI